MIATILPGSTNFHAVGYNERKVSKGVARLLEIQNFGALGTFGKPTSEELVRYLQEYSSRNSRIQKAQFHVAISCKGHEQSESELLEFAHQYLKEMGYGCWSIHTMTRTTPTCISSPRELRRTERRLPMIMSAGVRRKSLTVSLERTGNRKPERT